MHLFLPSLEMKPVTLNAQKFYKICKDKKMREEILAGKSCRRALGEAQGPQSWDHKHETRAEGGAQGQQGSE